MFSSRIKYISYREYLTLYRSYNILLQKFQVLYKEEYVVWEWEIVMSLGAEIWHICEHLYKKCLIWRPVAKIFKLMYKWNLPSPLLNWVEIT
jgi:hypothetical protein